MSDSLAFEISRVPPIFKHLMSLESLESVYIGVDSAPVSKAEVLRWIAQQCEKPELPQLQNATTNPNKRLSNKKLLSTDYQLIYPSFREGCGGLLIEGH